MLSSEQIQAVRDRFHHVEECPLAGPRAFFENAGGSYVPESVINRVTDYMRQTQVQPGANYPASAKAAERIADGQRRGEAHAEASPVVG